MIQRLRIAIRGAVQGVGFRPSVYRLAHELKLTGWVSNSTQGVFIEVEGEKQLLDVFLLRVDKEKPPRAVINSIEPSYLDPVGFSVFEIRESKTAGVKSAFILPDIATCEDCRKELFDPTNRRYRYPFINCTNCGPRYSIIESLPYDRPNTSMKVFQMCPACQREYTDPTDRRFHAQPNACPVCGPHVELWDQEGNLYSRDRAAILRAEEALRSGRIIAVKGIGGFHLMADARSEKAVRELRLRKHREEKPLAVMFPSIETVKEVCNVSQLEERLLLSPESPIVLLTRKKEPVLRTPNSAIASSVAPGNPTLGVMLPYSPLHLILMHDLGFPVVATSANISDEPICIDEHEAVERLKGIADLFLVHNRPIIRHIDDSVARVMVGREMILRRARGYAPLPVQLEAPVESPLLAVGGHLKNSVALAVGSNVFISQHIGDLETPEALAAFRNVISDFQQLYDVKAERLVCDLHPDYVSTKHAKNSSADVGMVQHHYAHIASCMVENQLIGEALGVAWDGTGLGLDNTIWGGEFLKTTAYSFTRVAHFRPFRLPGGEKAIREPRRSALGALYEMYGMRLFDRKDLFARIHLAGEELTILRQMLEKGVNAPWTSSAGRLFDVVASLLGLRQHQSFEGQAAMELEFVTAGIESNDCYEFYTEPQSSPGDHCAYPLIIQWSPMMSGIISDLEKEVPASEIATKFHNTLTEIIVHIAMRVEQQRIILSGGCFQNRYLTERAVRRLAEEGFRPYWHQRVPPNDGGIALGQIAVAVSQRAETQRSSIEQELVQS